jgi:uncharacterized protein
MPNGKPAGVRCIQLDNVNRCKIFGKPERPNVCMRLRPDPTMCGDSPDAAISFLNALEIASAPT